MITQARLSRIEDYAELRSWGLTEVQAAVRLGVTERTAERYEAHLLRQREGAMATSHQIEMAAAPDRAASTVDAGGPLGPKYEHVGGALHEVTQCGHCYHRYLAELDRCPRCREPSPDDCEVLERRAGLQAASWALRHARSHAQAKNTLIEMLWALGLMPDPQARPAKAPRGTIGLRAGYQRPGVV